MVIRVPYCPSCCCVSLLFLKIDKDGDNLVSPAELQSWMRHIQQQSVHTDTNKRWSEISPKDPDLLTWDEYVQYTYKDGKGMCYDCHVSGLKLRDVLHLCGSLMKMWIFLLCDENLLSVYSLPMLTCVLNINHHPAISSRHNQGRDRINIGSHVFKGCPSSRLLLEGVAQMDHDKK